MYEYHTNYYKTFQELLSSNQFVGKEQHVMAVTCIQHDTCLVLPGHGKWFLMQEWLLGYLPHVNYARLNVSQEINVAVKHELTCYVIISMIIISL